MKTRSPASGADRGRRVTPSRGTLNGYGQVGGIKALSLYATGQSGLTLPLQARPAPGCEVWPSSASPLLPQVREPAGCDSYYSSSPTPLHPPMLDPAALGRQTKGDKESAGLLQPRSATFSLGSGPPRRTSSGSVLALRGIASLTETLASPGAYLASTLGLMASSCSDPSVANTSQSADASKAFTSQQERPAPPAPSPTSLLMDAHATLGLMGLVLPRGSSPESSSQTLRRTICRPPLSPSSASSSRAGRRGQQYRRRTFSESPPTTTRGLQSCPLGGRASISVCVVVSLSVVLRMTRRLHHHYHRHDYCTASYLTSTWWGESRPRPTTRLYTLNRPGRK
ncbi:hypothetical protein O3P69_017260 [Scylla paramamosain]|uniref:Uncharacterized protein n=1 Tax=Scylla paramamosain TaxID=85552 RepID=A0AAW0TV89_SCYPA